MSNTGSRFQSTREKLNTCSHLTECTEKSEDTSRTSPSARRTGSNKSSTSQRTRMDQTKDSALLEVHWKQRFALLRVIRHKLVLGRISRSGDDARYQDTEHNTKEDDNG